MKRKYIFMLYLMLVLLILGGCVQNKEIPEVVLLPNLPYPIAHTPALITSAGQGPEGLIVAKMCDKLKIENKYRYKAEPEDLENMGALIIVGGISSQGLKAAFTNLQQDSERITRLMTEARHKGTPIVIVFPSGKLRRTKQDDALAEKLFTEANYVIAIKEADDDYFYTLLSSKYNRKLTLKQSMLDIPVPLNSVFR